MLYLLGLGLVAIGITLTTFYPSLRGMIEHAGGFASPPADVIPMVYRGQWIEDGAECGDRDAELRVAGHSIDYDRLSFLADKTVETEAGGIRLHGQSFADGEPEPVSVSLQRLQDGGLRIISPGLNPNEEFRRCR